MALTSWHAGTPPAIHTCTPDGKAITCARGSAAAEPRARVHQRGHPHTPSVSKKDRELDVGGRLPRRLGINVWVHLHQYECRSAVSGRYRSTLLFLQTSRSILQRCRPSRCAISFLGSPVSIKPRRWQRCLSESRFIGVLWRSRTSRAVVFERKSRTTWGEEPLLI